MRTIRTIPNSVGEIVTRIKDTRPVRCQCGHDDEYVFTVDIPKGQPKAPSLAQLERNISEANPDVCHVCRSAA